MPSTGQEDEGVNTSYVVNTYDYKMVSDYAKMSFLEINNLYCDEFLLLLRDAFIYKMRQTEQGREYLEDCKRFEITSPDREKLRQKFDVQGGE